MEELVVFLTIVPDDGPTIWMLTEPGIIGKIGMNSCGIGVCLNILRCGQTSDPTDGLPIHLVLRTILNAKTLDDASRAIKSLQIDTASNILAGDGSGACFDIEFAGPAQHWLPCRDPMTWHTNHYCGAANLNQGLENDLQSSFDRYDRTRELASKPATFSLADMSRMLSDRAGEMPINRCYEPYEGFPQQHKVGTVATIMMDLPGQNLYLRRGPLQDDQDFVAMPLPHNARS